ncbi:hypothetical protein C1645_805436 [Glomus cerebriforme]|uniref:Uncharacterized protein n=1 Tax=Glomus cerebriforme TaxID=658196 RepID=A0A397T0X9_9GLOM|nr:hypothetical protein C1645_805436 [Glomus cerebriforme]
MSSEITKDFAIEGRISIPYDRYQYKSNIREDQIILRVDIKRKPYRGSSGVPENPHLWYRFRWILIVVIVGLFFLFIIWLLSARSIEGGKEPIKENGVSTSEITTGHQNKDISKSPGTTIDVNKIIEAKADCVQKQEIRVCQLTKLSDAEYISMGIKTISCRQTLCDEAKKFE